MSGPLRLDPPAWLAYDRGQAELAKRRLLDWPRYDAALQLAAAWLGHGSTSGTGSGDLEALATHLAWAGHGDIADALRGGEDDPVAAWLVGEVWAHGLHPGTSLEAWGEARKWIRRHRIAYLAFDLRLRDRIAGDGALAERLVALAEDAVGRIAADPGAAVRSSFDRGALERTVEHWLRPVDPGKDWHEAPTLHELWGGLHGDHLVSGGADRGLLSVVRWVDRRRFLSLLARFTTPHPVEAQLDVEAITSDLGEVCALLADAPAAFDADLAWNKSYIAPLLLGAALKHLGKRQRARAERDRDAALTEHPSTSAAPPLDEDLRAAARRAASAAASRPDGQALLFRFATWLVHDLSGRLDRGGVPRDEGASGPTAPQAAMLGAVVEAADAEAWVDLRPPDLPPRHALLAEVARTLALERHGLRGEGVAMLERFVPRSVERFRADPAAARAIGHVRTLGPAPDARIYRILGRHLAQEDDPASAWRGLWRRCHNVRALGRRFSGKGSYDSSDPEDEFRQHDVPAVAPVVAALGLGALDRLVAAAEENADGDRSIVWSRVEDLWTSLYDAAIEQWTIDPVGREYWETLLTPLATRRWEIARGRSRSCRPSGELGEGLRSVIQPLVGMSRTFFSVLIALRRVGARTSDLVDAATAAGGDIALLIDQAEELRSIDPRHLRFSDASWGELRTLREEAMRGRDADGIRMIPLSNPDEGSDPRGPM